MSPIELVFLVTITIDKAFALVVAVMSVWALVSALSATNYAYESAFKRTKNFWVAVTAGCTVVSLLMLFTNFNSLFLQLIVATAAGVFMADVRPAVTVRRR